MAEKIGQKDAVVQEVKRILGGAYTPGTNVKELLSKAQKDEMASNITNSILKGDVVYNKEIKSHDELRRYVRSMIDNHIKKSKDLNGGNAYRPASSTSPRTSSPELLELGKLLRTYPVGSAEYNEIHKVIVEKKKAARVAAKKERETDKAISSINMSVVPEDLKDLIKKLS